MKLPSKPLRIAVADDDADTRQFFEEVLTRVGHQVVAVARTGKELVDRCRSCRPELIITDIRMPDMEGTEAAALVNREHPVPVILVTGHPEVDFLAKGAGHVMAHLSKPIKETDLHAAIALATVRFEQFQHLQQEAASLRQALEDRKLIERAKGIVMKRLGIGEEDAFARLRKIATVHNHKLIDVAQRVAAAEEIFQQLERL